MSLDITPAEALLVSPNAQPAGLSDRTLWVMAAACGTGAANIYYNQPLLDQFSRYFSASQSAAGMVATAAQVGYGAGIFFFVPLGDLMERRRLVLLLTGACCLLLILAAMAPTLGALVVLQLLVGIVAVSAQVLIPLGIDLTPPEKRGHTVGILMAGLLMGILLARTVGGFLGELGGWRLTFAVAAGIMLVMWFVLRESLPHRTPSLEMSYGRLMHSMIDLLQNQPKLWTPSVVSGLSFAAFMGFWTTLSFLMKEHFHRGAAEAGLFGVIGLAGAMIAPVAGKLSDHRGPGFTVTIAVLLSILSFVLMGFWVSIASLVIGVVLMDLGVQSVQVAEQATVIVLVPEARSRINTLYMVARFLGGAGGSALGAWAWSRYRWSGVCTVNAGLLVLALAVHLVGSSNDQTRIPESMTK
jgi:predicted MFS family arabinose efflux permease